VNAGRIALVEYNPLIDVKVLLNVRLPMDNLAVGLYAVG